MKNLPFVIGLHRPVYLWAGQATVRMNRLKFMDAPVDEWAHEQAHQPIGAQRIVREMGCNWAYLMYNWGFPPEIELFDWEDFQHAVKIYHAEGIKVFGYVQSSNCVFAGSYVEKNWYAFDPRRHRFHYYTGRYMTCWSHPEWLAHLREIVRGIVLAEADGVFFDNLWNGTNPMHFLGAWMGTAGCYCERCQAAYRETYGTEIPTRVAPGTDQASRTYLRWRAAQVSQTLADLSTYARSLNPEIIISANDYDPVMRPSYLVYGIDLPTLAKVQDVVMIEDFALPNWEGNLLVNNAITLRTASALIRDTPLSTIPYDQGIGFDSVYPPRRFEQSITEAAACGASTVIKATEYVENGSFTLLTADQFASQRTEVGQINRWLESHSDLYQNRENAATVGLLHPGEELYWYWDQLAPLFFGAGQTLLAAGIPWRVVTLDADISGLEVLLTFGKTPTLPELQLISVPALSGWKPRPISFLERHPTIHTLSSKVVGCLYRAYFESRWFRILGDRFGITNLYMASPLFNLPELENRQILLRALGKRPFPRVESKVPVLVEYWQRDTEHQLHLVNYASQAVKVTVEFNQLVRGEVLSPDDADFDFLGQRIDINLDVYNILVWELP